MIGKRIHFQITNCTNRVRAQSETGYGGVSGVAYTVWETCKRRLYRSLDRVQEEWNR